MYHIILVRAGIIGVLLAVSLTSSSSANAQASVSPGVGRKVSGTKQVHKTSFAFRASELYLAGGTVFDMTTTIQGLSHPTTAYRSDDIFLTHYYVVESGWAGCFGKRDIATAVAANVMLNVGIDWFSRRLYARGGRWRVLAFGALLAKGTSSMIAAGSNIQNNERIDRNVRLATGYQGRILWSSH